MSVLSVQSPYPIFTDTDGDPLESGYIWIGVANLDPQVNPLAVFWDAALTMPAVQPIRTLAGYPSQAGSPGRLYSSVDYSIRVQNKRGSIVFSAPNASDNGLNLFANDLANNTDPLKGAALVGLIGPNGGAYSVDDIANKTDTTKGASLVGYLAAGANQIGRTVHDVLEERYSVFNAMTTAEITDVKNRAKTLNVEPAITKAIASGHSVLYFPSGTYRCDASIKFNNMNIIGDGIDQTVFDFSSASDLSLELDNCVIFGDPTSDPDLIPDLSIATVVGARTITLVSDPGVATGDIILLRSTVDYSWQPSRDIYKEGEVHRVASVAGNVVTIEDSILHSYDPANMNCYKINTSKLSARDFTVVGKASLLGSFGVTAYYAESFYLSNIKCINASYAGLRVRNCYDGSINSCIVRDDLLSSFGADYGLLVSSCTKIKIINCSLHGARHGFTSGMGSDDWSHVNRYISLSNSFVSTDGGSYALDHHGSAEYCAVIGCTVDGGIGVGGDNIMIANNLVIGRSVSTPAIYIVELAGMNFTIIGNYLVSRLLSTTLGAFISSEFEEFTNSNGFGTLFFKDNHMSWEVPDLTQAGYLWGKLLTSSTSGKLSLDISNNTLDIKGNKNVFLGHFLITMTSASSPLKKVTFSGNNINGAGLIVAACNDANKAFAVEVIINDNKISQAFSDGITIKQVSEILTIDNNVVTRCRQKGINIQNTSTLVTNWVSLKNNTCFKNMISTTGTSTDAANILASYCNKMTSHGNCSGNLNKILYVAANTSFTIGQVVTGVTSGKTALITSKFSTTGLCIETSDDGAFTAGETLTDPLGGSSTVAATPTVVTSSYNFSYKNITILWNGNNPAMDSLTVYKNAIGTDNAI